MSALRIENASVQFNGRKAVTHVSLKLGAGSLIGLIGPNGAGKTTLLRAIANLIPFSGDVFLNGENIAAIQRRRLAQLLAYMPQGHEAHWPLTAARVIALGRLPHLPSFRRPSPQDIQIIRDVMKRTDTQSFAQRNILTLSGGERARVMLARALAVGADFLMADEPVAALDPYHQLQIMALLRDLACKGATIIVVTHDLTLAARFCHRLILMREGKVVAEGVTGDVLTDDNLKAVYNIETYRAAEDGQPIIVPWRRLPPV